MGSYSEGKQEYGRRLLPQIVDDVAAKSPDRIVYSMLKSLDDADNISHITASAFARAIDKTAWWLKSLVGETSSILSLGYIGPRKSATHYCDD